jgi:hypothetical protein
MGTIDCPETSVRNHHYSLRNVPEEPSSHLLRGGSLKSRIEIDVEWIHLAQDRDKCRAVVNTVVELRVLYTVRNCVTS